MLNSSGPSVTAIKAKAKYGFFTAAMFYILQKNLTKHFLRIYYDTKFYNPKIKWHQYHSHLRRHRGLYTGITEGIKLRSTKMERPLK